MRARTLVRYEVFLLLAGCLLTCAQTSGQVVEASAVPAARWTPSSAAPERALSHALEARRHDLFIELAQRGDIDLVFFGTTEAEMWWWPDRGRSVWDREFGSLRAQNFGSQGTQPASLLWRMQNGELDGYRARLIVLQAGGVASLEQGSESLVQDYRPLLDEIRLRQPQAKILLFAPLPRGGTLAGWQASAAAHEALFASLVDNDTVFYTSIGDRFFNEDGSFKTATWDLDVNNRGTQTAAFEIWAEALQPWIDRFLR